MAALRFPSAFVYNKTNFIGQRNHSHSSISTPPLPATQSAEPFYSGKRKQEAKHFAKMAATGNIRQSEGSQNSIEIDDLARFAVEEHNKKQNALLEFKNVKNVKQQVVAGTMYHLTLEAADGGKNKVYEAKVWVKPWMNFKEVQEFKHVGDA